MGGRGSGSISGKKGRMPKQPKGPAGLDETFDRLEGMGFNIRDRDKAALAGLGEQFMQDFADEWGELEGMYGAMAYNNGGRATSLKGENMSAYMSVTRFRDDPRVYAVTVSTRRSYDKFEESLARDVQSNWHPTTTKSGVRSSAAHEYGHLLQFSMAKKAGKTTERQIGSFTAGQKKKIMSIAKNKYGATSMDVSRYGLTNGKEFFAEAFASLHGGSPNAIGLAMRDYLAAELGGF